MSLAEEELLIGRYISCKDCKVEDERGDDCGKCENFSVEDTGMEVIYKEYEDDGFGFLTIRNYLDLLDIGMGFPVDTDIYIDTTFGINDNNKLKEEHNMYAGSSIDIEMVTHISLYDIMLDWL